MVESNNVKKALKVIDDLLKAEIGNPERLKSIKEKLEKKIRITYDEVAYLQEQMKKLDTSKPEEPIEDTPKKTPPEKPPKVKASRSMPGKKPIIVGVLGGIGILFLILSADAYFTVAPFVEDIERLENAQTMEEAESILEEISTQLGAITASPCLNLYNKIQGMENTYENVDEKAQLVRDYIDLRCNDTADQWSPERKLQIEKQKQLEILRTELAKTPECIDLNQIHEDYVVYVEIGYDIEGAITKEYDQLRDSLNIYVGAPVTFCLACETNGDCNDEVVQQCEKYRFELPEAKSSIIAKLKEPTRLMYEAEENYNLMCNPETLEEYEEAIAKQEPETPECIESQKVVHETLSVQGELSRQAKMLHAEWREVAQNIDSVTGGIRETEDKMDWCITCNLDWSDGELNLLRYKGGFVCENFDAQMCTSYIQLENERNDIWSDDWVTLHLSHIEAVDDYNLMCNIDELEEAVIAPKTPDEDNRPVPKTPEPDNRPISILESLFPPTPTQRLENARTLAEFESAIEEGDLQLGELTTSKCSEWLDEYALHDADPIEYRKNWQGTIWEYTEYIPVLAYKFVWFQCYVEYQEYQ